VLSNKVLKHGFVQEMESILDNETKITHDELSKKVNEMSLWYTCLRTKYTFRVHSFSRWEIIRI
jgi:nucleosome binding factor SPN SPT16 subunit